MPELLGSNTGLDGWPKARAIRASAGEIEVHQRPEAIDCLQKLPGPLYRNYRFGKDWLLPEQT